MAQPSEEDDDYGSKLNTASTDDLAAISSLTSMLVLRLQVQRSLTKMSKSAAVASGVSNTRSTMLCCGSGLDDSACHGIEQPVVQSAVTIFKLITNQLLWTNTVARGAGEIKSIRTLQSLIGPILVPILTPLVRQLVNDELAKREVLINMKENPEIKATASVSKRFKLQFRNKIALPVYTGERLLSENESPIEIALVDARSDQIVDTGPESAAKLKILGFRVGNDDNEDGSWTYEHFQESILCEQEGKRRMLQGNTSLQLNKGVCYVRNKISFTHSAVHTRNGLYRLVAVVVDADLINGVEVAKTEAFFMKDRRYIYHEKHACPSLSAKVCCLKQIGYKGPRYTRLKDADVCTVKDLLRLLYTNPKRLEEILELKASCKFWDQIVKSAQASNGTFLYLDPRSEQKTGVVLDVKLQLKALIVEPHWYIAVSQLTEQQKFETQDLVKFASEHFDMLLPFDHETYLEEHLQSIRNDVTTQTEQGKQKVPFDDEMILSSNNNQEYVPFHRATSGLNFKAATESGTSSQAVESLLDTHELMNITDANSPVLEGSRLDSFLNGIWDIVDESPNVSFCAIARARWKKLSKLLRRNSVRERISLSQGIQPLKKQRCC